MKESNWLSRRQKILIILTLILVVFLSFGLGYLSGYSAKRTPIIIEKHSN